MDDGTYHENRGVRFCTNSFTLEEVKRLGAILNVKYGIETSQHKTGAVNQYGLYVQKKSMGRFKELVNPYIHPTMRYKLGESK